MRRNKPIVVVKCYESESGIFARSNKETLYEKHSSSIRIIIQHKYRVWTTL